MKHIFLLFFLTLIIGCESPVLEQSDVLDVKRLPGTFGSPAGDSANVAVLPNSQSVNPVANNSWLKTFNSPDLNLLVESALKGNYALAQQAALIELAEQNVNISGSNLLPTLDFGLSAQRADGGFFMTDQYRLNLSTGYEVDLWGKLSSAQKRSQIDLASQRARYLQAERSLVRDVVNAGFDASSADQLLALLNQRLANLTEALDVIERGYRSGLNAALDVYLSRNTLELEKAGVANQRQVKFEAFTRLELLLGSYPRGKIGVSKSVLALNLESVDVGIPSELLQRRPDIQSAWLDLLAADIGVAIAHKNRFPGVNLSASGGVTDQEFEKLINGGAIAWTLAASLVQPLFRGGRLAALEEQAKIQLVQQEKRYLEVVFNAMAEVENELSRGQVLLERYEAFVRAEDNAEVALELAFNQYQRGLVTYTTVLEAQRRAFDAQTTLIQLRNQQLKNRVNLLLALGGEY